MQIRLAADELLQIGSNICVLYPGDDAVPGLQLIKDLVEFEHVHRPGKACKVDIENMAHGISIPSCFGLTIWIVYMSQRLISISVPCLILFYLFVI